MTDPVLGGSLEGSDAVVSQRHSNSEVRGVVHTVIIHNIHDCVSFHHSTYSILTVDDYQAEWSADTDQPCPTQATGISVCSVPLLAHQDSGPLKVFNTIRLFRLVYQSAAV